MKTRSTPPARDALASDAPADPGYSEWKQARIERALAEADARETMIPAAQVWRDLGLER